MTLKAQMEKDFLGFSGLEEVDFITRRTVDGANVDTPYSIDHAHPAEISRKDQELGDAVLSSTVTRVWNIRKKDLDEHDVTPRQGDIVKQSDGTEWSIRSQSLRSLATRYRFVCSLGRQ